MKSLEGKRRGEVNSASTDAIAQALQGFRDGVVLSVKHALC